MEEENFEFKKLDNGKYAFVMKGKDIERTEVVDKSYAKNHYIEIKKQKHDLLENLNKLNKELEKHRVEKNDELEHFIELANSAASYKKMLDLEANQKTILDMISKIDISIKHIENVIPELKR